MALSGTELDRIANTIKASDLTVRLHTGNPGSNGTSNRLTTGGTAYQNGVTLSSGDWTTTSGGDFSNDSAISYGAVSVAISGITFYSVFRGSAFVAFGAISPQVDLAQHDTFEIPANALSFMGATS